MTFGTIGTMELVFLLLICALPVVLLVWFVRKLTAMDSALRNVADRLETLERSVRDTSVHRGR